jgi:antirestriction protein ArdC
MKIKVKDESSGEERTIIRGFKGVPVFRIEDTEGEEVEVPDYAPKALPPLWERAEALGVSVAYRPYVGGFRGFYAPAADHICLVTEDMNTFFHELAHAAHARIEKLKGGQVARDEIIAEAVAGVLCLMYGVEGYVAKSHDYIAHYAKGHKNPAQAVLSVLGTIQKVLDIILNDDSEEE